MSAPADIVDAMRWLDHESSDKWRPHSAKHARAIAAELERLRIALRAVRASTDPRWIAQIISDALRETEQ